MNDMKEEIMKNQNQKKTRGLVISMSLVFALLALAPPVSADTNSAAGGSSYVYVSNVSITPNTFYPYEKGTVSITLTNNGNSSVGVTHPSLLAASNDVSVVNEDQWKTLSYIGSGNSITYTFQVKVNGLDGKYFALFTVETKDDIDENLHYPLTIDVDSEDLHAAISRKPETFTVDSEESVNLSLVNPRDGEIKSVYITTSDSGSDINPSMTFVSSIPANSIVEVPFTVTAHKATNITFDINYQNGEVKRQVSVVLPVRTGNGKDAAVPTINNLALTSQGQSYDLTGDITNTGVSDANGVVVTTGSPAKGTGTYPEYAVGSLASDDSSSFEVTFTSTDLTAVPLVIHWKDAYGTDYSMTKILDLTTYSGAGGFPSNSTGTSSSSRTSGITAMMQGGPGGMSGASGGMGGPGGSSSSSVLSSITNAKGGLSSFYPVIAMFILIVAGGVAYSKRKWIMAKVHRQ